MAEELEKQRAVRRANRGVVTKLTKEVDTLLAEEPVTSEKIARLNVIFDLLENKLKLLNEIDRQILSLCKVDDVPGEVDESEAILDKVMDYKRRISAAVRDPSATSLTHTPAVRTTSVLPPVTPPAALARTRLPKLTIAKFRGEITNRASFWDAFKSAIHENADMSKVDKFNYLNSLLEGVALRTIKGLSLTEDNYDSAVELLRRRFGNPQHVVAAHYEEIFKLPNCSNDRASSLRYLYDKVMVHTRGLNSSGIEAQQYGSILIPVLMSKLPADVRIRVAREQDRELWDIKELLKIIQLEVEARESSEGARFNLSSKPHNIPARNPHHDSSASSLVAQHQAVKCVYCTGNHFSASCSTVKDIKERKAILMRSGRCFNCLKPNHRAQNCDRMKKCRFCQRRHHQSICENKSFGSQELPTDVPTTQAEAINTCTNVKNKQLILLQTARATAVNRDKRCSLEVRILFDSGSQRSYVTNALKTRLKLNPIKVERLNLNTFGEGRFKKQNCDVVRLCLCKPGSNEAIPIEALSFPMICSPPPSHVDLTKLPKLQDLNLADYSSSTSHDVIDILVGSDYYWSIVTGEVMKTEMGLVAVNSKLGWLLSGPTDSCTTEIVTHSNLVISSVHPEVLTGPEDDKLHSMLNCFWETDSYGTHPESTVDCSHEDFLPGLQFVDSHYQVNLPWNHDKSDLPTHYQLCYNRLRSLQNKLLHKPALMSEYQRVIQDQLDRGIIEPVVVTAQGVQAGHYMPHHPVIREDKKTTKVRVVYDGSAKMVNSLSLNDCLQRVPILFQNFLIS